MTSPDNYQDLYQSMKYVTLYLDNAEKTFFAEFGLTTSRFFILQHVHENPGINYIDLSNLMVCTKGNVSRIVQGMIQDNLIERMENPEDRRSFQLFLSKSGEYFYKEVNTAYKDYIYRLFSKLNENQLDLLSSLSSSLKAEMLSIGC